MEGEGSNIRTVVDDLSRETCYLVIKVREVVIKILVYAVHADALQ